MRSRYKLIKQNGRKRLEEYDYDNTDVFGYARHVQGFHVRRGGALVNIPYPSPGIPDRKTALEVAMEEFGE